LVELAVTLASTLANTVAFLEVFLLALDFKVALDFFSLVSGHIASRIRSDIFGCVFHDSSIRLSCDVRFGSNIDLNCSGLVLSNISSMVC
jgi:hypothetical protein